jgi:hypothetical protein
VGPEVIQARKEEEDALERARKSFAPNKHGVRLIPTSELGKSFTTYRLYVTVIADKPQGLISSDSASRSLTSTRSSRWCCQWQVLSCLLG